MQFLEGGGPDHLGRYLSDYRAFTDQEIEGQHDFIQWMFPLWIPSRYNPHAPVLDEESWSAIRASDTAQNGLLESFEQMLSYYGLSWDGAGAVCKANDFSQRSKTWRSSANHNQLRITRMISSLFTLGLETEAQALAAAVVSHGRGVVSGKTLGLWQDAGRL